MVEKEMAKLVSKGEDGARCPVRGVHEYQREGTVADRRSRQRVVLEPLDKDTYLKLVFYGLGKPGETLGPVALDGKVARDFPGEALRDRLPRAVARLGLWVPECVLNARKA